MRVSETGCDLNTTELFPSSSHRVDQFTGDSGQVGGEKANSSRFDHVLDKYPDVFGSPGKPPEREVKHRIDLYDENAPPPRSRVYRMS